MNGIYEFKVNTLHGEETHLDLFKGKVGLIVNTASKCGFTKQYEPLQKLYEKYRDKGFVVLGFPCNQFGEQEPGTNKEIDSFCQMNFGVSFPMFEKVEVNGDNKHPLFGYLTEKAPFQGFDKDHPIAQALHARFLENTPERLNSNDIKWNFTKFLVNRKGEVVERFESYIEPEEIASGIDALL
ncbi:glutathione peroxidase [Bacillus xiapuensis]|uniref:Glutathione peroxidase n=1 Tax=Bacillus xiapuensis TaxID=2014075 RepID=A0ABU6NE86_9BACI|nr:glutathione peroxidase [Bacillus xiapuensis]